MVAGQKCDTDCNVNVGVTVNVACSQTKTTIPLF